MATLPLCLACRPARVARRQRRQRQQRRRVSSSPPPAAWSRLAQAGPLKAARPDSARQGRARQGKGREGKARRGGFKRHRRQAGAGFTAFASAKRERGRKEQSCATVNFRVARFKLIWHHKQTRKTHRLRDARVCLRTWEPYALAANPNRHFRPRLQTPKCSNSNRPIWRTISTN